ncbi:MAG TPA: type II toxin-antitoxin system RelE/ParE family toxin [Oligoflexia bacterium]|nr:type II toxin-antitoxin system RelE/ParE family toxin [Oligoflexia bacterium]
MSIRSYKNQGTAEIAKGINSKAARQILPSELHGQARRRLARLQAAVSLDDIRGLRGNRYHPLHGRRRGQHAIAINDQYRICFQWTGQDAEEVEIVDYHC